MRQSVEFVLVSFHMGDEVHEMEWFLKLLQVFSINKVTKLILNTNNKLDNIEGIKTMILKAAFEVQFSLLSGAEVVTHDRKNVLIDFVVGLKNESVLLSFNLFLPKINGTGTLVTFLLSDGNRVRVKTELVNVSSVGSGQESSAESHSVM
eukprot:CAMPEP_0176361058 /NCGR_PEP_ID=MMETSP0126-20121128/17472_1 /TAXON_ID=141414 ORGANISM="Strombidinopsis acuminatum, Strain SPMC142" /NCGR_SAMPLE_ID=MMETSP0126 /ASSEMBLY_ACC=CAM_ASM_000229 /LENGTH=149 /DNA_ID=CAMNT_0017716443 /DNA_START=130 /DNA_END=579 /DNA_ORIENTATION=+